MGKKTLVPCILNIDTFLFSFSGSGIYLLLMTLRQCQRRSNENCRIPPRLPSWERMRQPKGGVVRWRHTALLIRPRPPTGRCPSPRPPSGGWSHQDLRNRSCRGKLSPHKSWNPKRRWTCWNKKVNFHWFLSSFWCNFSTLKLLHPFFRILLQF